MQGHFFDTFHSVPYKRLNILIESMVLLARITKCEVRKICHYHAQYVGSHFANSSKIRVLQLQLQTTFVFIQEIKSAMNCKKKTVSTLAQKSIRKEFHFLIILFSVRKYF